MAKQEQLAALELLSNNTRAFIEQLVQTHAPTDTLLQVAKTIKTLADELAKHQHQERPAPHFNFKDAHDDTRGIVPYSPITGRYNPVAPIIDIRYDKETQQLFASIRCGRSYEGPPNSIHGGTIAGLYDQLLAMAAACFGKAGPTAYLNIRFLKPSPLFTELTFRAWVAHEEGRKVTIKGECTLDGTVLTEAEGLFIHYQG